MLAPVAAAAVFWRQRDWFGIAFCWAWLATNLFSVATYVADARAQQLHLVSPGAGSQDEIIHDWNFPARSAGHAGVGRAPLPRWCAWPR